MGTNTVSPKEAQTKEVDMALGKKLEAPEDMEGGPNRHCTDVLFMFTLILMWITTTYLGVDGISNGDPNQLLNGIDYDGRICGVDDDVEDKPKLYYIRFDGTGVCVESCPDVTDWSSLWGCTDDDAAFTYEEGYDCELNTTTCLSKADLDTTGETEGQTFGGTGQGTCMYQIESLDFVGRCVFSDSDILSEFVDVGGDVAYLQEAASDVYAARFWIIAFGYGFSTILGFLYISMMRVPGTVCIMVWGSILCVFFILVAMGYLLVELAADWHEDGEHTDAQVIGCKTVGYLGYGCAFLFLCLIVFLRKRITLANGIVKESARAIGRVKVMMLMPVLQCLAIILFLIPWVVYCVYTASMGDIETTSVAGLSVRTFEYSEEVEHRGWFLLFSFFWTTQFIVAMGQIMIALTIVKYYFTRDVQTVNNKTFCISLKEGIRYHMGTAAFGSLIIAIIQIIRTVLTYVQTKLQKSGNRVAQAILCCLSCCFWCLEQCVKFVNKNAYIQVAIFSTPFCTSSKNAFWLIARNLARVGAVTVVTDFVVLIMKTVIGLGASGALYLFLQEYMDDEIYSPVGPVLFAGVMAYYVASSFAGLLGMTTLTILQCFIADEEMFCMDDRYARNDLKLWLEKHGNHKKGQASPRSTSSTPISPRSPQKGKSRWNKGEGKSDEGQMQEQRHAVHTGTA